MIRINGRGRIMTDTQIATAVHAIIPILALPQSEEEFDRLHKATLELAETLENDDENPLNELLIKMTLLIEEYEEKHYPMD
jgi:antitoxin component HigA of HigAB toxin-antitoxin module